MTIKKSTLNNTLLLLAVIAVVILLGVVLTRGSNNGNTGTASSTIDSSGKQVFELTAKFGYSPNVFTAKANIAGVLRVKTNGTIDCSTSLRIPQLNVTQTLPRTGTTDIAIAAQTVGTQINGTCSMGMYHFTIKFI